MLSGNICLLKRVCEIMSKQNNVNNNSTEAMRILLAVEIMLSPSSIALPSIPATVAAKNYLTDKYATSNAVAIDLTSLTGTASASASSLGLGLNMRNDDRESSSNKRDEEINVEKKSSNSMKRNRNENLLDNQNTNKEGNEEIDVNEKKRLKNAESSSSLFIPNESISVAFGNPKNREVTKSNSREDENNDDDDDDDDDDSLPDIDINADPEL